LTLDTTIGVESANAKAAGGTAVVDLVDIEGKEGIRLRSVVS
jgi:hypothetical protein